MKYFNLFASVVSISMISTFAAHSAEEMPNQYFDTVAAKLMMAGFRNVRVIDEEKYTFSAFDEWGSEVVIKFHPSNRKTLTETFVHPIDE